MMTEIHFMLSNQILEDLDWDDLELIERTIEGENKSTYKLRPILARYMVNGDGVTPIPIEEALEMLRKLKASQIKSTMTKFGEALSGKAIPKSNGSESKSPSEARPADSPSQTG